MKGRASLEKLTQKRASDNSKTLARETPALRALTKPRGEARGDAPKLVPRETPEPETPRFKGDVNPLVLGGITTEAPKRAYVALQEQLYNLDQKLSAIMEERRKEAAEIKKRIEIQNQEAKIMADKDKNMLNSKIKMEMDMEKDALRRMKDLKSSISKIEVQTKNFEKSIEVLTKKRRAEEAQKGKQLDALMAKENQVRLKREQAEAALSSLDLVQKQKILQKSLIQKQLLRLESGIEDEEPEEEPEEEEEEEEVIEIPPPPLPDIPEQPEIICEDPCRDICNMVRCMDENFTKPCMPNPRQYCPEPCITNCEPRQYSRPCITDCEPRQYSRPCITDCEPRQYPRHCIPCEPILPVRCDPNHPICSNVPCDPYVSTFNLVKVLTKGYFAEVALVKSALTNNKYVIKSICKKENISKICRMKTVFSILAEHKHPFVVNMHDVIQDDNRIHFVMEYLSNGNLKEHLKRFTVFDESEAVFFSACALLAIEHLHSLDIAHRDIKLDNLVLDGCGYAKIVDFDLAIPYVMYNTPLYDKSGTSIYKCPEFFKPCEFTTRAADFWALGVVIHALLTAKCINTKPCLRLAEERLSAQAEDLLASMLNLVPSQRLGYSVNGGRAIMKHVFYKDVDWTALYQKRLHPPKRFLTKYWKDYSENETYRNRSFYGKPPL